MWLTNCVNLPGDIQGILFRRGKGFIFKSETIAFMAVILIFQMIAGRIE